MKKKLKAKIIEHFGTQADFAQALKTDESTVSRVVRGRRCLSVENQKIWARKLRSSAKDLFQSP